MCFTIAACAEKSVNFAEQQNQKSIIDPFIGKYHSKITKALHLFYHNFNNSDLSSNTFFLIFHFSKVHVNCLFIVYEMGIPTETLMEPGPSETLTAEDTAHVSHARARRIAARRKFNISICNHFNSFPRIILLKSHVIM